MRLDHKRLWQASRRLASHPDLLPGLVLGVALLWLFRVQMQHKYLPMQDVGHHMAIAAVVADWGRPGSLYTPLYERFDPLNANSLLYLLAGYGGRLFGVTFMVRLLTTLALIGVPLANWYALGVFGRSRWGAVVSVPLTFNLIYMLGFSNNLVAAPLLVLSVPVFYRYLERPSWRRWLGVALLVLLVFMAHAQVFLWTGVLLATLTVYMALRAGADRWSKEGPLLAVLKVLACSFAAVVPALLCFGRWYYRTFVHVTGPQLALAGPKDSFGAVFIAPENVWNGLLVSQRVMKNPEALKQQWALVVLLALALVLARFYRWAKPPILEAAFFLSLVSYFLLPENLTGQDILASRQISVALWFSAVLFTPIPARVSRFAHWAVVAGILAWSGAHLRLWSQELAKFEAKEAHGLDEVMMAAPPRLAIHYVKDDPESEFFYARPFWHVEKWYMSEKLGRGDDTTGVQANGTIRFREGVVAHRGIGEGPTWVRSAELWDNFDLVLLRRRSPRPEERAELEKRAYLLSRVGDWEMWRKRPAP